MKLITVEEALASVGGWLDIPDTHELIRSDVSWNWVVNESAPYIMTLEWNKVGEAELDGEGLINKHIISVEMNALTSQVHSFYRHEYRTEQRDGSRKEMEEEAYQLLYPQVLLWIEKLNLPVKPSEMRLMNKNELDENVYEFVYDRAFKGVRLSNYQSFTMRMSADYNLITMNCNWEICTFLEAEQLLPLDAFKGRFNHEQLSITYSPLLSMDSPAYLVCEDSFEAIHGELIATDRSQVIERIDLTTMDAERNQPVKVRGVPVFRVDNYDVLRLPADTTHVDLFELHPFVRRLTEGETERAKNLAISCVKVRLQADDYEYAFVKRSGGEFVESIQGNQIRVEIQRMCYGIPVSSGRIQVFIDHDTWEVNQFIDGFMMFKALFNPDSDMDTDQIPLASSFVQPAISKEDAWKLLKDKYTVKYKYQFDPAQSDSEEKKAIPVYTLDCDWIVNAVTGELEQPE